MTVWFRQGAPRSDSGTGFRTRYASRWWRLPLRGLNSHPESWTCRITDEEGYFISESSVYRILKAYDLIPSPAYIVVSASDRFKRPTRRVNEMWQTDFTYLPCVD